MKKRRDQVRFRCPKCGFSALLSYYESAVHMRDCGATATYYHPRKKALKKLAARR